MAIDHSDLLTKYNVCCAVNMFGNRILNCQMKNTNKQKSKQRQQQWPLPTITIIMHSAKGASRIFTGKEKKKRNWGKLQRKWFLKTHGG